MTSRPFYIALCLILWMHVEMVNAQLKFQERAVEKGLTANYGISNDGGGISFHDFNLDGWDDVTLTSQSGQPVQFFQNNNGQFTPVTFNFTDGNFRTKQALWVDFDNDGDKDLFVTSDTGLNKLYQNDGNMNLTDISVLAGFFGFNLLTTGATWGDYDNDGYLDVFLTRFDYNYGQTNRLYHNNGDATFTDVTASSGIGEVSTLGFGATFFDFNNDGWQDIYVITDRVIHSNILYKNNGDGTFTDVSVTSGTNVTMDAMSVTVEDFNNDGWLDIYITNTDSSESVPLGNALLINNGDETFTNLASQVGVTFDSYGWGALFLDADLDTYNDIYVSGFYTDTQPSFLPSAFYHNQGNDTCVIPTGIGFEGDNLVSYSNALGDYNNDGLPDMVVMNNDANVFLWENQTITPYNYLNIKLEGTISNRDGIGARIEVLSNGKLQYRAVLCGEGYLGQNSSSEFIGIGSANTVDYVKVTWPSGLVDIIYNVTANQTLTVQEGSALMVQESTFKNITLYPNPNNGLFQIDLPYLDEFDIVIYDLNGRTVYQNRFSTSLAKIDQRALPKGVYFLKITSQNGSHTDRFVID